MSETNVLLLVIVVVAFALFQNLVLLTVAKLGPKDIRLLIQYMARLTERIFDKFITLIGDTTRQIVMLGHKLTPTLISSLLASLIEMIRKKFS